MYEVFKNLNFPLNYQLQIFHMSHIRDIELDDEDNWIIKYRGWNLRKKSVGSSKFLNVKIPTDVK